MCTVCKGNVCLEYSLSEDMAQIWRQSLFYSAAAPGRYSRQMATGRVQHASGRHHVVDSNVVTPYTSFVHWHCHVTQQRHVTHNGGTSHTAFWYNPMPFVHRHKENKIKPSIKQDKSFYQQGWAAGCSYEVVFPELSLELTSDSLVLCRWWCS